MRPVRLRIIAMPVAPSAKATSVPALMIRYAGRTTDGLRSCVYRNHVTMPHEENSQTRANEEPLALLE